MTEQITEDRNARASKPLIAMPTTIVGKIGCGFALLIWFIILMLPCSMFWLASGSDITLNHRDVPDAQEHPFFQISLIMQKENRGLQVMQTNIIQNSDLNLCVESSVRFILWQSESDEDLTAVYCQCYQREEQSNAWSFVGMQTGICN